MSRSFSPMPEPGVRVSYLRRPLRSSILLMSLVLAGNVMLLLPKECDGFRQPSSVSLSGTRQILLLRQLHASDESSLLSANPAGLFLYNDEGSRGYGEFPSRRDEYFSVDASSQTKNKDYYSSNRRYIQNDYMYNDDDEFRTIRRRDYGSGTNFDNSHRTAETINTVLRASRTSFRNVEDMTYNLFNDQPLVALGIFVTAGTMVAYMLGFVFLGGYIDNWNPVVNDVVPYWDEPEIHTITRVIGK